MKYFDMIFVKQQQDSGIQKQDMLDTKIVVSIRDVIITLFGFFVVYCQSTVLQAGLSGHRKAGESLKGNQLLLPQVCLELLSTTIFDFEKIFAVDQQIEVRVLRVKYIDLVRSFIPPQANQILLVTALIFYVGVDSSASTLSWGVVRCAFIIKSTFKIQQNLVDHLRKHLGTFFN